MSVRNPLPSLIGESPAFLDTLARVSVAAQIDRPLLVIGERGTGKELIAERIHFLSGRWDGPFVKVNCAALSEELLDSELFGHESGAFTGAKQRRPGRFERADGGTLFLDEIGTASATVQEKLLRVIEYGEYERVGGSETLRCNVRVIGATNIDLMAAADAGHFRADLLDRLAFDVIPMPPMRARREDILPLAEFFGANMARELGERWPGLTLAATDTLEAYPWPGNVRELKNAIERSVYRHLAEFSDDEPLSQVILDPFASPWPLDPLARSGATDNRSLNGHERGREQASGHDAEQAAGATAATGLPGQPPHAAPPESEQGYALESWLNTLEKNAVEDALKRHSGSQKQAAAYLQLTYNQMRGLVRKHGFSTRQRS